MIIAAKVAAWTTAALLGATGVSYAADATAASPGAPAPAPKTGAAAHHRHPAGLLGRALHGVVTVEVAKAPRTVEFQRGTIASVTGTTFVVHSRDGYDHTYHLDAASVVRTGKGAPSKAADITAGETALVVADPQGDTVIQLHAHPARPAAPGHTGA